MLKYIKKIIIENKFYLCYNIIQLKRKIYVNYSVKFL